MVLFGDPADNSCQGFFFGISGISQLLSGIPYRATISDAAHVQQCKQSIMTCNVFSPAQSSICHLLCKN